MIRCARLRAIGHGDQILVSDAAAGLVVDQLPDGVHLADLGTHRLKDLGRPERVWQVIHPDLPAGQAPLRSLDVHRHNLPVQLTPLIGRETDVVTLGQLVSDERLVTLTGSGGVGKTRLALAVVAELLDQFPGGVWFVELASVADPAGVGSAVSGRDGSAPGPRAATRRATDRRADRGTNAARPRQLRAPPGALRRAHGRALGAARGRERARDGARAARRPRRSDMASPFAVGAAPRVDRCGACPAAVRGRPAVHRSSPPGPPDLCRSPRRTLRPSRRSAAGSMAFRSPWSWRPLAAGRCRWSESRRSSTIGSISSRAVPARCYPGSRPSRRRSIGVSTGWTRPSRCSSAGSGCSREASQWKVPSTSRRRSATSTR